MDERRSNNGQDQRWGGETRQIAMPEPQETMELEEGAGLQQLVERQPVFVMAATLLFAVGAICVVAGAFLLS